MLLNLKLSFLIIWLLLFQTTFSLSADELSMAGVYYRLEINEEGTITNKYQNSAEEIRSLLRKNKIRYLGIKRSQEGLEIAFKSFDNRNDALSLLQGKYKDIFSFIKVENKKSFPLSVKVTNLAKGQIMDSSIENIIKVLKNRTKLLGVSSSEITKQNSNQIEVRINGITDFNASAFNTLHKTINSIVKLKLYMIDEKSNSKMPGREIVKDIHNNSHVITRRMIVSSKNIVDSIPRYYHAQPALELAFDNKGMKRLLSFKSANLNKKIAVVLIETTHLVKKLKTGKIKLVERQKKTMLGSLRAKHINEQKITLKGLESFAQTHELSLLLNSGIIMSPYYGIEERTIDSQGNAEFKFQMQHSELRK